MRNSVSYKKILIALKGFGDDVLKRLTAVSIDFYRTECACCSHSTQQLVDYKTGSHKVIASSFRRIDPTLLQV